MRFYMMVTMIAGVLLILNMAGIITPVGSMISSMGLIDSQGNLTYENVKSSNVTGDFNNPASSPKSSLAFVFGGLLVAAIVIGVFGRSPDIRYITVVLVAFFTSMMMSDLIWLFIFVQGKGVGWVTGILSLLIGSMLVGLVITAIQFWQGTD